MKYDFHDTFAGHADDEYPAGWQLERHSPLSHRHAYVQHKAFALMLPGNKHLPVTPALADFTLEAVCHGDPHFNTEAGLVVYVRYDPEARRGYYVRFVWGASGVKAEFGIHEDGDHRLLQTRQASAAVKDTSARCAIRLAAGGNRFEASCAGAVFESFEDPGRTFTEGRVAFDHAAAAGSKILGRHVFLESVRIESAREFPARDIWPPVRAELPAGLNGMPRPFVFEIAARDIGGCAVLSARLTGGATRQPPECPGGFYTSNEELLCPYIRLETAAGVELGLFRLVNGTVGLRRAENVLNFLFYPADAECPLERQVCLAELPADARLFVGYERYHYQLAPCQAGGPMEAWVDPATGRLGYVGAPLRPGARVLELHSPGDKAVSRRLSPDDPRFERARAFARDNHFFVEGEPCAFRALLRFRDLSCRAGEWRVSARLENAFREPMDAELRGEPAPASDPLSDRLRRELGVESLACELRMPGPIPVGVYHLAVRWHEGAQAAAGMRRAFEVMPADPRACPAPLASGLPELHAFPDEARSATTNTFDPWATGTVDDGHYMTGVYYQADFARARQVWKTLHAYGRQFQFIERNCGTRNIADYADVVREADLVCAMPRGIQGRLDLWKRGVYRGVLLETLRRFAEEQVPDPAERERLTQADPVKGVLTPPAFECLTDRHWKPWLDYANRFANGLHREMAEWVRSLNPRARWTMLYGVHPTYAAIYKAGYFPLYTGFDMSEPPIRDWGPVFLEDYPFLCRYGILRGVFQLAAMKLRAPGQRIFPELYPGASVPQDGLLLCGHPPYALCHTPPPYLRKRLLAFACGAVWFGAQGFSYWTDHGFHARGLDPALTDTLLDTWAKIRRLRPVKPVRSTAFAFSLEACRAHPDTVERHPASPWGDSLYNTAEESTAYAYEQAQESGRPIGFILDLDAVARLDPADGDVLVLPPLTGVSRDRLDAIREKHQQGVALLGMEDVTGLEDLFGVAPRSEPAAIERIRLAAPCAAEAGWRELAGLEEPCGRHPLCRARYQTAGARPVLEGLDRAGRLVGPLLVRHRTDWGDTALWCAPPTIVNRADAKTFVQYGQACLSRLVNRAATLMLRALARPVAETTAGKLIAFHDADGGIRVLVMEDAWPDTPRPIEPRVTLRLPGVQPEGITGDRPFSVLSAAPGVVSLRLHLDPHDCAVLSVAGGESNSSGAPL